ISSNEPHMSRTLKEVEHALTDIIEELNFTLHNAKPIYALDKKSDKIQVINQEKSIMMEAHLDELKVFKPFIQTQDISVEDKARLFLHSLGIPPVNGRNHIEISGGKRALRNAIRALFQSYVEQEQNDTIKNTDATSLRRR
ncbi:MAG TPA: hypothetical protein VHD33_02600, partial [Legionellaceae bacterium]|nr:hypothetical protein [Legionellaceae bacterium]